MEFARITSPIGAVSSVSSKTEAGKASTTAPPASRGLTASSIWGKALALTSRVRLFTWAASEGLPPSSTGAPLTSQISHRYSSANAEIAAPA
ncbi:MAG: hypothetical protein IPM35_16015 [Myxococcales bacterium]|nr:hypothetical protein [Myxococcales bacterium]